MANDIEDRPDINTGDPWSEMALFDLANSVRLGDSVEEIATFLCRSRREIREKVAELEQKGELATRVAGAARLTGGYQRPPRVHPQNRKPRR
jgi:predicted transcriptional regulator